MTFLAATPTPTEPPVDTLTYEMPDLPRLVDPAPIQDPALIGTARSGKYAGRPAYRHTVCEACGTFGPPDATSCRVCAAGPACGDRCCGGAR